MAVVGPLKHTSQKKSSECLQDILSRTLLYTLCLADRDKHKQSLTPNYLYMNAPTNLPFKHYFDSDVFNKINTVLPVL